MSRKNTCILATSMASALLLTSGAMAQHAGDIYLEVHDATLLTGNTDEATITHDHRVYASEFGESGIPGFSDEPGFDSPVNAFDPGSEIGFNLLDGLRVWNGTDFSTLASPTLRVSFASLFVDSSTDFVPGFSVPVSADGEFHKHLSFTLSDANATGVYLMMFEMYSNENGVLASEQFAIVYNNEEDELVHDEAIEYMEEIIRPGLKWEPPELAAGVDNALTIIGATPGNRVYFGYARSLGSSPIPGCPGVSSILSAPTLGGSVIADAGGEATLTAFVPGSAAGLTVFLQAVDPATCDVSNWVSTTF